MKTLLKYKTAKLAKQKGIECRSKDRVGYIFKYVYDKDEDLLVCSYGMYKEGHTHLWNSPDPHNFKNKRSFYQAPSYPGQGFHENSVGFYDLMLEFIPTIDIDKIQTLLRVKYGYHIVPIINVYSQTKDIYGYKIYVENPTIHCISTNEELCLPYYDAIENGIIDVLNMLPDNEIKYVSSFQLYNKKNAQ